MQSTLNYKGNASIFYHRLSCHLCTIFLHNTCLIVIEVKPGKVGQFLEYTNFKGFSRWSTDDGHGQQRSMIVKRC